VGTRALKFLSFYRPYLGLLTVDLICAFIVSAITLILPLCVRHITQNLLDAGVSDPIGDIALMAGIMLALVAAQTLCGLFVDYQGHMMGAMMESDMRRELFAHFQKLSFSFYDEQKTGQLMSRITNDLFAISELAHHGPEDLFLGIVKFIGVFLITLSINPGDEPYRDRLPALYVPVFSALQSQDEPRHALEQRTGGRGQRAGRGYAGRHSRRAVLRQ